jgi:two-component system response regulator FixJ
LRNSLYRLIQIKAAGRGPAKIAAEWGRKRRPMIFIVDDDEGVRDSLRLLLECEGFEAREFASCLEFLEAGPAGSGDCLILDVHVPGMSGLELLEVIRARGEMLPVIVISGRTDAATRNRAHAAGALAVIEKPYQAEEVLALARRALAGG